MGGTSAGRGAWHRTTAGQAPLCSHRSRVSPHHMPERMWLRSNNCPAWKAALTGLGPRRHREPGPICSKGPGSFALPTPCKTLQYYHRSQRATAQPRERKQGPATNRQHPHHPAISQHLPYRVRGVLPGLVRRCKDTRPPSPTENSAPADLNPPSPPSELSIAFFFCSSSPWAPPPLVSTLRSNVFLGIGGT